MKGFDTLVETGIEQAIADYIAGLMRVYLTPNEGNDERLIAGLKHARARYESAKKLVG